MILASSHPASDGAAPHPAPIGAVLDSAAAAAIADELVDLTRRLSDLAFDLGSDPETLRRHMTSLQALDLVTQIHLGLADILRASGPFADRLGGVTVDALAERLRTRLADAA